MPNMPVLTKTDRARITRWEFIAGKAMKDWVTRVMQHCRMTRDEARAVVLDKINSANLYSD